MTSKMNERKLLFDVRTKKNKQAFGELYDLYVEKIYRFIYFKINNKEEAEDLTSDVFLKTWNYLMENREKELLSFSGLVYRIARNNIIDLYRKRARMPEVALGEEAENVSTEPMQEVENIHDAEKLLQLIKKLKQDYQEVLILKHVEELSIGEIAEITGRSSVGVRVILHRAMNKLKELSEDTK
ncbi:MAG: RNA polymerase sigma factor [Candidatus Magasanikiibacteriota bacterium]